MQNSWCILEVAVNSKFFIFTTERSCLYIQVYMQKESYLQQSLNPVYVCGLSEISSNKKLELISENFVCTLQRRKDYQKLGSLDLSLINCFAQFFQFTEALESNSSLIRNSNRIEAFLYTLSISSFKKLMRVNAQLTRPIS